MKAKSKPLKQDAVSGRFVAIKHKFTGRSDAEQELQEWIKGGKITNYRIAWDSQLRMTVEVVYP